MSKEPIAQCNRVSKNMPVGPIGKYDYGEDRRMIDAFSESESDSELIYVAISTEDLNRIALEEQNTNEQPESLSAPMSVHHTAISDVNAYIMTCISFGYLDSVIEAIRRARAEGIELNDAVMNAIVDFSEEATAILFSG